MNWPLLVALLFPWLWGWLGAGLMRITGRRPTRRQTVRWVAGQAAIQAAVQAVATASERDWPACACAVANLLVALVLWWWLRKDRKRAKAWLGAKSRALVAALVRNLRRTLQSRPVLAPGGAS